MLRRFGHRTGVGLDLRFKLYRRLAEIVVVVGLVGGVSGDCAEGQKSGDGDTGKTSADGHMHGEETSGIDRPTIIAAPDGVEAKAALKRPRCPLMPPRRRADDPYLLKSWIKSSKFIQLILLSRII